MDSQRVRLLLSYDGTEFEGWQRQADGTRTIQSTIEDTLEKIFEQKLTLSGASRTDTGVHAFGQVAHFSCPKDPKNFQDFCYSLQSKLPPDIVVKKAWLAPPDFHSTRYADSKTYHYVIHNSKRPSALRRRYSLWIRRELDIDYLNACTKLIEGAHNFASFQNAGGTVLTTDREIVSASWHRVGKQTVVFKIHGKGFLKQMVRNIVGTSLELAGKGSNPNTILEILAAQDRTAAGPTAEPQGLYLMRVLYPSSLDKRCRNL